MKPMMDGLIICRNCIQYCEVKDKICFWGAIEVNMEKWEELVHYGFLLAKYMQRNLKIYFPTPISKDTMEAYLIICMRAKLNIEPVMSQYLKEALKRKSQ
jgi:hypothetical protein